MLGEFLAFLILIALSLGIGAIANEEKRDGGWIIAILYTIFSVFLSTMIMLDYKKQTYLEVYTNKAVCYLEERKDRTTYWSCENVRGW